MLEVEEEMDGIDFDLVSKSNHQLMIIIQLNNSQQVNVAEERLIISSNDG